MSRKTEYRLGMRFDKRSRDLAAAKKLLTEKRTAELYGALRKAMEKASDDMLKFSRTEMTMTGLKPILRFEPSERTFGEIVDDFMDSLSDDPHHHWWMDDHRGGRVCPCGAEYADFFTRMKYGSITGRSGSVYIGHAGKTWSPSVAHKTEWTISAKDPDTLSD